MMKTILAAMLAFGLMATATARAANLLQGNREIGLSGLIDFDTADDTLITLDLSYGYFLADFLEGGVRAGISDSDTVSAWRLGLFSEYHFFFDSPAVPFLGASLDLLGAEIDTGDESFDETAVALGFDAGVKYFVTDAIAIATQLGLDLATDKVYPTQTGADDTNWDLTLGIRFYF